MKFSLVLILVDMDRADQNPWALVGTKYSIIKPLLQKMLGCNNLPFKPG